jgi:hypothetical protein
MIESDLYLPIKKEIENILLEDDCKEINLEITANNRFSTSLKNSFGEVLKLLDKSFSPDLSGYYKKNKLKKIVIEVKKDKITIQNIYQTIAYQELINADFALLISPEEIPTRIKTFLNHKPTILQNNKRKVFILKIDKKELKLKDNFWYPFKPSF